MSIHPSPTQWYRLTNLYTGEASSLAAVNDNGPQSSGTLQMADTGNLPDQYWRFVAFPTGSTSTYALYTQLLGEGKRLDVWGDDKTKPHLADAGIFSGQIWTLTPWGDGTYQLTNNYSGSELHLDVYGDTKVPFLGEGNQTGQRWHIRAVA